VEVARTGGAGKALSMESPVKATAKKKDNAAADLFLEIFVGELFATQVGFDDPPVVDATTVSSGAWL
jgi:hypothetical protein